MILEPGLHPYLVILHTFKHLSIAPRKTAK